MAAYWKLLLVPTLLSTVLSAPQFDFAPPEVPSGLYETPNIPVPVPPPVPSGLYETPVAASNTFAVPVLPPELIETPQASNTNSLLVAPQELFPNVVDPPKDPSMKGMPYDFTWGVQDPDSGNAFSHVENSDGQRTEGEYRVLLPDGRTQVVRFFDNGQGYNAQVTFE